jgi:MFS family permease
MVSTELWMFILFLSLFQIASGFAGVGPAALQLVTPNNYRGQISAAYLFAFNLIGTGVGPTAVGFYTTYLFRDDAKIGWAIALNSLVCGALAVLCLFIAMAPMRKAMDEAQAWAGPEPKSA